MSIDCSLTIDEIKQIILYGEDLETLLIKHNISFKMIPEIIGYVTDLYDEVMSFTYNNDLATIKMSYNKIKDVIPLSLLHRIYFRDINKDEIIKILFDKIKSKNIFAGESLHDKNNYSIQLYAIDYNYYKSGSIIFLPGVFKDKILNNL
jgi:hypothetical protein